MVVPEWPPTTGMANLADSLGLPSTDVTKVLALTMSRVVTPKRLTRGDSVMRLEVNVQRSRLPLGVENASFLHYFGDDRDRRVDRVRNDTDKRFRAVLDNAFREISNDARIDLNRQCLAELALVHSSCKTCLEEVIASHSRLQGNSRSSAMAAYLARCDIRTFRGTPAGMTTMSASLSAFARPSLSLVYPVITEGVLMCDKLRAVVSVITLNDECGDGLTLRRHR